MLLDLNENSTSLGLGISDDLENGDREVADFCSGRVMAKYHMVKYGTIDF